VKDSAEQRLILHRGLHFVLVDAEAELRVFRLLGGFETDETAALEQRRHRHRLRQTRRRHVPFFAHLGVGLVQLAHRYLLRLPAVIGNL
jgi:hypothetical protein